MEPGVAIVCRKTDLRARPSGLKRPGGEGVIEPEPGCLARARRPVRQWARARKEISQGPAASRSLATPPPPDTDPPTASLLPPSVRRLSDPLLAAMATRFGACPCFRSCPPVPLQGRGEGTSRVGHCADALRSLFPPLGRPCRLPGLHLTSAPPSHSRCRRPPCRPGRCAPPAGLRCRSRPRQPCRRRRARRASPLLS